MNRISMIIFVVVLIGCLYVLIRNLELERAQEAFAIIIAAAVAVVIFVSLKSETIAMMPSLTKKIVHPYFLMTFLLIG